MLGIRKKANISQAGELAVINSLSANSLAKISSDLLDKTLKCMNVLMDIASHSLRNTIIDQVSFPYFNIIFNTIYSNIITKTY